MLLWMSSVRGFHAYAGGGAMRSTLLIVIGVFTFAIPGSSGAEPPSAREIVEEYLSLPVSPPGPGHDTRSDRVRVLYQLKAMPDEAVTEIARVFPETSHQVNQLEFVEILGRISTRASADVLIPLLQHPDPSVRGKAVWSLRLHAMRSTRFGPTREAHGPDHPPAVEGLVPYLVAAADDEDAGVRVQAMYALADTHDPAAHAKLREALGDENQNVRFLAACFLTEFDDDAGLGELRLACERLRTGGKQEMGYHATAQHLFASLERITGEHLGDIPPDPLILSVYPPPEDLGQRFESLLDAWSEWLAAHETED